MSELKPCPFCGGEAIVHVIEPHTHIIATFMPDYPGRTFVECLDCDIGLGRDTEQEAIEAWNRRVELPTKTTTFEQVDCHGGPWTCNECGDEMNFETEPAEYVKYCWNCGARVVSFKEYNEADDEDNARLLVADDARDVKAEIAAMFESEEGS